MVGLDGTIGQGNTNYTDKSLRRNFTIPTMIALISYG